MIYRVLMPPMMSAGLALTCGACTVGPTDPEPTFRKTAVPTPAPSQAASGPNAMSGLVQQFPGAALVNSEEFSQSIQEKRFRYQPTGGKLIIHVPKEVFRNDGVYEIHGTRTRSFGTYTIERDVILINCTQSFLGLGKSRVFFKFDGSLFMASADGRGGAVKLISEQ